MPRQQGERYAKDAWHRRRLEIALGVVQLCGLITSVVISRRFGPTGRGTLTEVTIWVQVLGFGATMSLDKALVVTSRSAKSATARREISAYVLRRALTYALIVAGGGVLLIGPAIWTDPVLWLALGMGCLASTANEVTLGFLLTDYLEPRYIRCRLVQPALLMTGTATVAFSPLHLTASVGVALVALLLPMSLAAVPLAMIWRNRTSILRAWRTAIDPASARRVRSFAAKAQVANGFQYINQRLDLLVLPVLVSPRDVGIYAAATAAPQVLIFLGSAGLIRGLSDKTRTADSAALAGAAGLAITMFLVSSQLLTVVYGPAFGRGAPEMRLLLVGAVGGFLLQGNVGRLLSANKPGWVATSQAIGALTFVIGICASPSLLGAATASCISSWVSVAVSVGALRAQTPLRRSSDVPRDRARILVLAPSMVGAGGVQQVTRDLVGALNARHDVRVVSPPRSRSRTLSLLRLCLAACRVRLLYRPAAIVCLHVNLAPLARLVALGRPYVVVAHGREVWGKLKRVRLKALQAAVDVWSVSSFTDDRLVDQGIARRRLRRLKLGVDVAGVQPARNESHSPEILIIARLTHDTAYKGTDALIQALPRLQGDYPGLKLRVAGSGNAVTALESLADALHVRQMVDFLGYQTEDQLRSLRASCWIFALPCRARVSPIPEGEGLGLVLLEASAAGMPVIAGNAGGATDAVVPGVTGLLVAPGDIDDLVAGLRTLLGDRDLRDRMGRAGYRWICAQRSREASNGAALALVGELMAERTETAGNGDVAVDAVVSQSELLSHSPAH
jgi:glycosyltransferase involved in cell wall biosynthesis/O-antigen/teichoic acid export membrane protein